MAATLSGIVQGLRSVEGVVRRKSVGELSAAKLICSFAAAGEFLHPVGCGE